MFAIQKHKNGDGMILSNWLATSKNGGGGMRNWKIKLGTNYNVNTKLGKTYIWKI